MKWMNGLLLCVVAWPGGGGGCCSISLNILLVGVCCCVGGCVCMSRCCWSVGRLVLAVLIHIANICYERTHYSINTSTFACSSTFNGRHTGNTGSASDIAVRSAHNKDTLPPLLLMMSHYTESLLVHLYSCSWNWILWAMYKLLLTENWKRGFSGKLK